MRSWLAWMGVALVFAMPLAAQPGSSAGAPAPSERLVGRFVRDAAASDDVPAAIERAVAQMSFVTRGIGRSRLKATNQPPADVRFALPPDSIVVQYAGQPELRARRDGSPREWRNAAGEPFQARVTVATSPDGSVTVRQVFEAEDGRRENAWRLEAAGTTLTLDVTVSSPRLPQPLRYRHVFRSAAR
ncbi:hypothetical protein Strain138_000737 [Pseudogemmatithrix spongiicola]|uniref:Uncharacterized protein n=1 Tax=Pseudogemmatithrix spongiicola TaxID=3062599 RepID=A0AA49JT20_9BACT|nr:hypothetical protein Strain138_000737 [Gemmatimonadaceae bacterium 'strain 138']WKW14394.1 hypothetical protein Strain318_000737 [Gemmatimonadaceae bacterium 'strain 318']